MQQTRETFAQALRTLEQRGEIGPRKRFADKLIAEWRRLEREAQAK